MNTYEYPFGRRRVAASRSAVIAFAALCTSSLYAAGGGAYPSSAETDISASDSTTLYPEEIQRRDLIKDSKVIFVNGNDTTRVSRDSVESLLVRFYIDQFRNSQDPQAPYFTFMSKDANFSMGVGVVLKMRGYYDWNGMIDGASFNPYRLEIPKKPEDMRQLGASVAGTTIYFSIMGRHTPVGNYSAYVEGGFNGYDNSGFKLKKAWIMIGDFTAGLATTTFSDPAAQPSVLDGAGANGKIDKSNVLVRYLRTFRNRWTVAASVEIPTSSPDVDDVKTSKMRDYVPDFAMLGQYQWNRGLSHVRVAGLIRTMSYIDLINNRRHHVTGWGAQLSTVVKAGRYLTFYGLGCIGQGISSYTGDLSNGRFDLIAKPTDEGELYAPTTVTATAGVKVNFLPSLYSTVCLSTLRTFARDGTADATYKYGQYLAADLVYEFTPRLSIGIEYLAGKRMNYNGEHGNANRAQAVFTASF